jgi:putative sugar O-methyltransferase
MVSAIGLAKWAYLYGFSNLVRKLKYRKRIKSLQKSNSTIITNTSITDSNFYSNYPFFCTTAATNEKIFREFRTYKEIIDVLDHVTIEQANQYLVEILKFSNWEKNFSLALNQIDSIGKPFSYKFKQGVFSPTLLRYLKTYLEIQDMFGDLHNYHISEIGVGFGGQAAVFKELSSPKTYTMYDLNPTLDLVKKFLSELNLMNDIQFMDGTNPLVGMHAPDLLISNYAFSELNRNTQDKYLENLILKSPKGYMAWNCLSQKMLDGYSLADLIRIIPMAEIVPEIPHTNDGNAIIVWGNKTK